MKTTSSNSAPVPEDTIIKQETNQPESKSANTDGKDRKPLWRSVIIGGVSGIALGAGGTALASDTAHHGDEPGPEPDVTPDQPHADSPAVPDEVQLADSVDDDMSFGEAFAAARSELGAGGVFEWHGQLYSTYTQGEWAAMSDEQKDDFAHGVSGVDIPQEEEPGETASETPQETSGQPTEPQQEDTPGTAGTDETAGGESQSGGQASEELSGTQEVQTPEVTSEEFEHHGEIADGDGNVVEVEVVEAGRLDVGGGQSVAAVAAEVDGHDSLFVDVDNDGYVDVIAVDADDDGEVQEDEVIDMQGSDMQMTELASAEELGYDTPEEDLFAGTPDYTNDADVSSLA